MHLHYKTIQINIQRHKFTLHILMKYCIMIAYQRFVALAAVWSARFSTFVVMLPAFSIQRPSFYSRMRGQVVL
jgi:hypothetical protein